MADNDNYYGFVYDEVFSLSPTTNDTSRNVYDMFGIFGDLGGTLSIFMTVSAFLVSQYAELSFQIMAIVALFNVKQAQKL